MNLRRSGRAIALVLTTASLSLTATTAYAASPAPAPTPTPSASAATNASAATATTAPLVTRPLVIGHRGASGYRPEHTLASYRLAIAQGADYVEPDLVSTKDHVLVARHENEISGTTDVADHPEFAARRTTKVVDGVSETGWFTEDFTLAELKTLRAKERLPQVRPANTAYDGRFEIPTFQEVLNLVRAESKRYGRTIGVYPETKHPSYFASIGLSLEEPLVAALRKADLDDADDPAFIQSFETANLRELDGLVDTPLIQLVDASGSPWDLTAAGDPRTYRNVVSPAGLADVATYADGIGANKNLVLPRTAGAIGTPSSLVADAHADGLLVHVWTMRRENQFLPTNFRIGTDPNAPGDLPGETRAFLDAGVDGVFSDNPDLAVTARNAWLS
ncbi:glycerophosphoryl diester phosphodiesterase [Nocardioides phosphati]|uniref:glycerophosphodiester phosphodiesterase n=1 Tax=Nocardioides phosphati TaxID=1867775 RepID=A0ABQ2NEM5_9ACTN|nr:glycerophosphodiester phosphodiesterase [Nocardioides phosphati]GGO89171.1 glycerophosphoryl diester phosphodiesterase [Nocardioides phosphati]